MSVKVKGSGNIQTSLKVDLDVSQNKLYIYSFDCAIKNLGICCISINTKWEDEIKQYTKDLYALYESDINKDEFLNQALELVTKINDSLNSRFKLEWTNVIDLIPGKKVIEVKFNTILKKLKYMLHLLNKTLPPANYVLIEYQMSINDKARGVSRYIEEFYTPLQELESDITIGLDMYPLKSIKLTKEELTSNKAELFIIQPSLKNAYQIDPSNAGNYSTYIEKYTNYVANKKHTTANFIYYMNTIGKSHEIKNINNKLNDIADAFMMAYAWSKKQNYI
jgi:hypothetical protein